MGTRSPTFSKPLLIRGSSKLEEVDYKGAMFIPSSVDSLADCNDDTLAILKEKHCSPQYQFSIPDVPSEV